MTVLSDGGGPFFQVDFEDAITGRPVQASATTTPSDPGTLGRADAVAINCAESTTTQAPPCFDAGVRNDSRALVRTKAADGSGAAHAFYIVVL